MINYKGVAYPLVKHHQGYFHNSDTDLEQLKSSIASIILTEPTERVMNPLFGTALNRVNLNQPIDTALQDFKKAVDRSLKRWEGRVQINAININLQQVENELMIMISIYFIYPINNSIEELHIQKSLGENKPMPFDIQ